MSLADDLKPIAIAALTEATGAAVRKFLDAEPDVATTAEGLATVIKQVLDAMPFDELRKYLTDDARERAEIAFRIAQEASKNR